MTKILLTVEKSPARDETMVKPICRIDPIIMREYGISAGDIVMIEANFRKILATVFYGLKEDTDKHVIRLPEWLMENLGVKPGDYVYVEKLDHVPKLETVLLYTKDFETINEHVLDFIKKRLENQPICKDTILKLSVLGRAVKFTVLDAKPEYGLITKDTKLIIKTERKLPNIPKCHKISVLHVIHASVEMTEEDIIALLEREKDNILCLAEDKETITLLFRTGLVLSIKKKEQEDKT